MFHRQSPLFVPDRAIHVEYGGLVQLALDVHQIVAQCLLGWPAYFPVGCFALGSLYFLISIAHLAAVDHHLVVERGWMRLHMRRRRLWER